MKLVALIIVLLGSFGNINAQHTNVNITVKASFGQQPLELGMLYGEDSITINALKFYISNLQLNNNYSLGHDADNVFLIDLKDSNSCVIKLNNSKNEPVTHLSFILGIDSSTNTAGALGGALDPTNGMYWTWQSGYINIKIEGQSKKCNSRNNKFMYHLGGYVHPNNAAQKCSITISPSSNIILNIDLSAFFNSVDLVNTCEIMSPSQAAVMLSSLFSKLIKQRQ